MKIAIYFFLMFTLVACAGSVPPLQPKHFPEGSGRLVIELTNLRNNQGEIYLSLYSGPKGFPADVDVAVLNRQVLIQGVPFTIVISDLPYGEYAVSVLHDENRDGEMNTSMVGVPQEGFGFSGNPKTKMGPPEYEDTRFLLLVPEKKLSIVMTYETVGRERQRIMQERQKAGDGSEE